MHVRHLLVGAGLGALAIGAASAQAQSSTETYSYDALGRLITVGSTGGQNNGETHSICYDPAGNRTEYKATSDTTKSPCVNDGGSAGTPPPPPPPPPTPSDFSISDTDGPEGETLVFAVTRSGSSSGTYTVNFATASGTAGAGDYLAQSGTLTFGSNEMVKYISVITFADTQFELTETFYVNLSNASGGATISDAQGRGLIFDDGGACETC